MSHSNLTYGSPSQAVLCNTVEQVDKLVSDVSSVRQAVSWLIDRRPVYRQLISKLIDQHTDVIEALRNEVNLLIGAKVRTDQNDRTPESLFHSVIVIDPKTDLSFEEIRNVTKEQHPADFIIGGHVNHELKMVTLYRGDFSSILVSFGRFEKNATSEPDFFNFKVTDHGMAISFGEYEASIYPILYDFDLNYRRRINMQRKREDKTFGACLFRARKILGFNQDDFSGVRRETIIRIENKKSQTVRSSTKKLILKKLNLQEKELLNY